MRTFIPGASYEVISPLNSCVKWVYTVVSRSANLVTLKADSGEIRTLPVCIWVYSDLCPFELVLFKIGRKNVRLSSSRTVAPSKILTGSRFSL